MRKARFQKMQSTSQAIEQTCFTDIANLNFHMKLKAYTLKGLSGERNGMLGMNTVFTLPPPVMILTS